MSCLRTALATASICALLIPGSTYAASGRHGNGVTAGKTRKHGTADKTRRSVTAGKTHRSVTAGKTKSVTTFKTAAKGGAAAQSSPSSATTTPSKSTPPATSPTTPTPTTPPTTTPSPTVAGPPAGYRPFAPDSIWNLALRSDAPIYPQSPTMISWLESSVNTNGTWINTTSCGMPEYWANSSTPTVAVTLDHPSYEDPALIQAWSAVPIPANAVPATCSDKNFSVEQVQPDGSIKEWELWDATKAANGTWTAAWGGVINNILTDRGFASPEQWTDPTATEWAARQSTYGWNVTASGASMDAGVVTFADLASGQINHALAMALNDTAAGEFMWPAQRSDGTSTAAGAIPEGAHLRINPNVNLANIPMTPLVRMLAEAAQKYGIVIRDKTYGPNVFYTEQPTAGQANPVPALLDGESPAAALKAFPWSDLEVLNAPVCTNYGTGCVATNRVVIDVDGNPTVGSPVTLDTTNSVLNYPRSSVQWELNGSSTYSTNAGTAVTETYTPTQAGENTVSVRITTSDGTVVTGTASFNVARANAASAAEAPAIRSSRRRLRKRPHKQHRGH